MSCEATLENALIYSVFLNELFVLKIVFLEPQVKGVKTRLECRSGPGIGRVCSVLLFLVQSRADFLKYQSRAELTFRNTGVEQSRPFEKSG
jgi:hypothetical protein